jgi:putative transposase
MPRRPRIHAPGAFYHVTLRGNHRKPIFFCDSDHGLLNDIVAKTLDRCQSRLHAYCWMPNHLHMLLQVGDMPLGRVVLRIASGYARSVQARLETTGHLFERRHHAIVVDADRYLLTLLRYIHLNPVRAGLTATAGEYPWSSHHHYSGTRHEPWVTTGFVFATLGGDYRTATARYRKLLGAEPDEEQATSPLSDLRPDDDRILGDDRFLSKLTLPEEPSRPGLTLDELIKQAGRWFYVEPADLVSASRDRRLSRARAWVAHEAVAQRIATTAQVARALRRDESTIRELVARHFPCRRDPQ